MRHQTIHTHTHTHTHTHSSSTVYLVSELFQNVYVWGVKKKIQVPVSNRMRQKKSKPQPRMACVFCPSLAERKKN